MAFNTDFNNGFITGLALNGNLLNITQGADVPPVVIGTVTAKLQSGQEESANLVITENYKIGS